MTISQCVRRVLVVAVVAGAVVVPAVPALAGGGCHVTTPTEGSGDAVAMVQMCMTPTVLHVEPGTTVTWTNKDPMPHNLYASGWYGGDLAPGASVTHTFDTPGTYPYACTIHPGMTGAVIVDGEPHANVVAPAAAPAAAVRPDDGSSGAGAPLVIGLLAVVLFGCAFAAGTWVGKGRVTSAT